MARQRRIEYEGAIYHIMARGDRREDIVYDDKDRQRFEDTLAEVVESCGWVVYAWVLMSNHYHFLLKTPEPNLVAGMTWFQNTWTRRFNVRHRLWGHLFGGRYKAILVEEGDYLTRLIHYVHLNPVRAGMVNRSDGLESYPWCSLSDYMKPPRKRRPWMGVDRGLQHVDIPDNAAGRRRFMEWTEGCVDWKKSREAGTSMQDGQSLQSTLRRGWYFGAEEFREKLLAKLGSGANEMGERKRKGYGGEQTRDHGIAEAERIIDQAASDLGIDRNEWPRMRKGDWRKGLVAGMIRRRALVDNGWLAERLHMGARNAVSRTIGMAKRYVESDRKARRMAKLVEQNVK